MKVSLTKRVSAAVVVGLLTMLFSTAPASAAQPYRIDLYFVGGYERQVDGRTCTAASTAMMVNFGLRRDVRLSQMGILRYAQRNDALNDRRQLGSDPLGWARAVTRYTYLAGRRVTYEWAAFTSRRSALNAAAKAIAQTRKPVGLVVWNGRHAVVMTGFVSTGDPRNGGFTLRSVFISDPYSGGPFGRPHAQYAASTLPFGRYLETDATRTYDRAWYGKWVIIRPRVATPAPTPTPEATPGPTPEATPEPTPEGEPSPEASAAPEG
jgi:hypothetical protein